MADVMTQSDIALHSAVNRFAEEVPKLLERAQQNAIYSKATQSPEQLEKSPPDFFFHYKEDWAPGTIDQSPFRLLGLIADPHMGGDRLGKMVSSALGSEWTIANWTLIPRPTEEQVCETIPKKLDSTYAVFVPKAHLALIHRSLEIALTITTGHTGWRFKDISDNQQLYVTCSGAIMQVMQHDRGLEFASKDPLMSEEARMMLDSFFQAQTKISEKEDQK